MMAELFQVLKWKTIFVVNQNLGSRPDLGSGGTFGLEIRENVGKWLSEMNRVSFILF